MCCYYFFLRVKDKLDCQLYEFVDSPSEFQTNIAALYKAFQDLIRRVNVKLDGDMVFNDATIKHVMKSIIQGVESVDKQSASFMRLVGKWSWLVDFYKGQTSLMASELKCKVDEFPDFNPHHGTFVHWLKEVSKVFMYGAVQLMVIYVWTVKLTHAIKENMAFDSAGVNAYKEAKEEEALQPMLAAQMKQAELQRPMWEAMMSTMIPALATLVKPAPVPPEPRPCRELECEDVSLLWDGVGCLSRLVLKRRMLT